MEKSILAENMFGVKSYYDVDVVSFSDKNLVIKSWNGKFKKLKFDDNKKCYVFDGDIEKAKIGF